ncbi:MAG: hypothetical protein E7638_00750 [Ruminococcaceae bacterium]|nr:hypothetical protein [Oscillospiraceae bacterium]
MKQLKKAESVFKNAEYIWLKELVDTVNTYVDFHETLTKKEGAEYRLFVTADTNYALYINGEYCDGGQYADYEDTYKVYDEIVITDHLKEGENEILITGYSQHENSFTYRKATSGIMYVFTENGEPVVSSGLNTRANKNPNYKSGPVPNVTFQLLYSFEYFFEGECVEPGEVVVTRTFDTLHERPIRKLVTGERCAVTPVVAGSFRDGVDEGHPGKRMQYAYLGFAERLRYGECKTEDGVLLKKADGTDGIYVVYDLGREEAGLISLDITLPCDAEFLFGWGEHLDDLRLRTNVAVSDSSYAAQFHGKAGRNSFLHPFKRSGCRYIALQIYAPEAEIHYAGLIPTDYPTAADITFHCADNLHNTIYEVAKRTMLLCLHEHHEDCPMREQALYGVDSRNQMLCGYYAFREFDIAKASIRLMALSIRDDNMIDLCPPAITGLCIPTFVCAFPIQTWEYLLYSGDREFVREMIPTAERICGEFLRLTDEKGMMKRLTHGNYWNFYEWQPGLDGSKDYTYALPLCAFVSMAYQSLGKIYAEFGDSANAAKWAEAADRLNKVCHEAFYNADEGYYFTKIDDTTEEYKKFHLSQLSNSLAVCAGICPEDELDRVLENIVNNKSLLPATLSYSIFRYDALMKRPEKYGRYVFTDAAETYGYMLRHNATAFWETIRGGDDFVYAASLCHGWSAVPIYLYFRYAAGIVPTAPGVFEKNPMPVELTGIYELTVGE